MIRACVVGLGCRGYQLIRDVLTKNPDLDIVSVCDIYEDRIVRAQEELEKNGGKAQGFTDYKEAMKVEGLGAVFVFSDWDTHAEIACHAMRLGIPVASEVGSERSLENCWALVKTQEETGTPYMFMENCCFGKEELLATALVRHGKFGTVVHCAGSYAHDLRDEVAYGHVNRHYRYDQYRDHCCDNYPTHDLGPIAKVLDINRGNRIRTVSSFATKAVGLKEFIATREDATEEMKNETFKQGDIIHTIITCENGETVLLRLDTTLPRYYSRDFTVRGTKGMYMQDTHTVLLDGDPEGEMVAYYQNGGLCNGDKYLDEFLPSLWKDVTPEALAAGHGGMDWFAYKAFVDAVKNGTPMPIDVYDGATWQAVGVLSEMSIANGGAPQEMPDFTNGAWATRPRLDVVAF